MQFLDAIGLAYFWEKIKNWVNINYLSLTGGTIRGSVSFLNDADGGKSIRIDPSSITNSRYGVNYLFASGKMIPIGEANGVAGLDANGRIPLAQLGNLDTSLFKLVTSLPSSGESNKIYIVKDGSDANDVYQEYYYTNGAWEKIGTHAVKVDLTPYAKKTEAVKNVDFRGVEPDGTQTSITASRNLVYTLGDGSEKVVAVPLAEPRTTGGRPYPGQNGFMRSSDKAKLDGIADGANNYTLPTASASALGGIKVGYAANGRNYPVQMDGENAYVNIPWTDTNTTYGLATSTKDGLMKASDKAKLDLFDTSKVTSSIGVAKLLTVDYKGIAMQREASSLTVVFNTLDKSSSSLNFTAASPNIAGLMSGADKTKLNGISSGATADSAITTAEIDALFA